MPKTLLNKGNPAENSAVASIPMIYFILFSFLKMFNNLYSVKVYSLRPYSTMRKDDYYT